MLSSTETKKPKRRKNTRGKSPRRLPVVRPLFDFDDVYGPLAALGEDMSFEESKARPKVLEHLAKILKEGHAEAERRLLASETDGMTTARSLSDLQDQLIRATYEYTVSFVYPAQNPTSAEHLCIIAVGGYGRGAMAPGSDVDLLFLRPYKKTPWGESVIEYMLYILWDLRQKVGQATRTVEECINLAKKDYTIRTSILEARYLWGDTKLFNELRKKFISQVQSSGSGQDFVDEKLGERDARHERAGASRYLVEPNIKEGKGGLRDLHTLFWIGKYLYHVEHSSELVAQGVFSEDEYKLFEKAENFLWAVRCHLHFLTGRAEERLSFDVQQEMATRLGYTERSGLRGVERFMKHYFLVAKDVGDLTRIFCLVLEVQNKKRLPSLARFLPSFARRRFGDFVEESGRLNIAHDDVFKNDPVNLIRLFHVADETGLLIHPNTFKQVTRSLKLINGDLRKSPDANALFLETVCSNNDPERLLRRMNESGVLGKFLPDFGKIVAMMQFNMYHHYTVDEHLIRAVGLLAQLEAGDIRDDHPLAHELFPKIQRRDVLYMAVLLHDIAKGRDRDHSEVGEEIARRLCPRLGMSKSNTETVAWLVRNHLVMSDFSQRRDISDPQTARDFAEIVQSPERLRLLLILTVVDIRAVGPGVWNGWKGQLLRDLYYETEPILQGGHSTVTRHERIASAKEALLLRLNDWPSEESERVLDLHYPPYWLSLDTDCQERHARMIREADSAGQIFAMSVVPDEFTDATEITVYTPGHAGLFSQLAGAFAHAGVNIVEAKIFTTSSGMALDMFTIQDTEGHALDEATRIDRIRSTIERTLKGDLRPHLEIAESDKKAAKRDRAFRVEPDVVIDNEASETYTVIEVNGRDRPGFLHDLTRAIFELGLSIGSARIATYGERAVDVFYVKDNFGLKVTHPGRLQKINDALLDALNSKATKRAKAKRAAPA